METATPITPQMVVDHYSNIARQADSQDKTLATRVAQSFGYAAEDLVGVPEGANLGVSCGNPLAIAALKPGETVLDLGCGAGFDVFQAARKVGPEGISIGIDMGKEMLSRAQQIAAKTSVTNVKFVLTPITDIPLESESADCIISNCVINLLPSLEKPVCFKEVYRLLKSGGRLAVSDILAKRQIPQELRMDMGLYVGCISGANLVSEYETWLREAGFEDIMIVDKKNDLNIYKVNSQASDEISCCGAKDSTPSCCSASERGGLEGVTANRATDVDLNEWASSYSIYAIKPN